MLFEILSNFCSNVQSDIAACVVSFLFYFFINQKKVKQSPMCVFLFKLFRFALFKICSKFVENFIQNLFKILLIILFKILFESCSKVVQNFVRKLFKSCSKFCSKVVQNFVRKLFKSLFEICLKFFSKFVQHFVRNSFKMLFEICSNFCSNQYVQSDIAACVVSFLFYFFINQKKVKQSPMCVFLFKLFQFAFNESKRRSVNPQSV